jgi:hypothetical protein
MTPHAEASINEATNGPVVTFGLEFNG